MPAGDTVAAGPIEDRFPFTGPLDLRLTVAPLGHARADPTINFADHGVWLTRRTAAGPVSPCIWSPPGEQVVLARAWGPGDATVLEAVPGLAGLLDDPAQLAPQQRLIGDLQRRFAGVRLPRTGQLLPNLIPAVTEQKVTIGEARSAYAALVRRLGEIAPDPKPLRLSPKGARVAALPYFEFRPWASSVAGQTCCGASAASRASWKP